MTGHSASETVRGSLLSIKDCALGVKECRRNGNHSRASLLGVAQRLIASGFSVNTRDDNYIEVRDACEVSGACTTNDAGTASDCNDVSISEVKRCVAVAVAVLYGTDCISPALGVQSSLLDTLTVDCRRYARHLAYERDGGLIVSKALFLSSPNLSLAGSSVSELVRGLEGTIDEVGRLAYAAERHPGRLHHRLLVDLGHPDVTWASALEAGPTVALALTGLHAFQCCALLPDIAVVRRLVRRLGIAMYYDKIIESFNAFGLLE